ncbi:MAG: protein-glutamate O-methyltransferase CheR [Pigmentiphaga sp.]|uniref:CheR family methyltransferase n=1 Tax=Pigmentiphaga sp. TaxID=1977564 RepID=UPI0029AB1F24|nr:protein-glutamate O-methyltransferase CheR [Pigmentiphaga sp.]MDX3904100.1 protein-glutamate O-methyltransferase CheR [Pigmentiphaga sp.]
MTSRTSLSAAADSAADMADSLVGAEFAFSTQDFDRIRLLLRQHTGISLSEAKRSMVYSRLARRLRATGRPSFSAYLEGLRAGAPEWEYFVNALTTNLTYFYREGHHFQILADFLKRRAAEQRGQLLQIWCAAASSGEEAWSLAMTAAEAFATLAPPVRILATDLDTQVLATAKRGVYRPDQLSKVPEALVRRYFCEEPDGGFSVRPELRALVAFRPLNLLDPVWPVRSPMDAVFCRNVLIYFDRTTQLRVVERIATLMPPGALLFVGHSENFSQGQRHFVLQGRTVYARAGMQRQPA